MIAAAFLTWVAFGAIVPAAMLFAEAAEQNGRYRRFPTWAQRAIDLLIGGPLIILISPAAFVAALFVRDSE